MRFVVVALLFFTLITGKTYAQQDTSAQLSNDTTALGNTQGGRLPFLDSVAQAIQARQQFVDDSVATQYIRPADPSRHSLLVDSLFKRYFYKGYGFLDIAPASKSILKEGPQPPNARSMGYRYHYRVIAIYRHP